jgi:hypothetical protein
MREIIRKWFGGGLFDVFSFPNLIGNNSNGILFRDKIKHPLQNYMLYELRELIDMHKTKKIVVFVSLLEGYPKEDIYSKTIEYSLIHEYPDVEISVVEYFAKGDKIEAYFKRKIGIYDNRITSELYFLCSDGRLIQIACEYSEKILKQEFCYHHICIPGTTTWITMSPQRKKMLELLRDHINYYLIHKLVNVHHGPDCGRFVQYHCIEGQINPKKAFIQHMENIKLSSQKLRKLKQILRRQNPDNHFNTLFQYYELDEKNGIIRTQIPVFNEETQDIILIKSENKFDFSTYNFTEPEIVQTEQKTHASV